MDECVCCSFFFFDGRFLAFNYVELESNAFGGTGCDVVM